MYATGSGSTITNGMGGEIILKGTKAIDSGIKTTPGQINGFIGHTSDTNNYGMVARKGAKIINKGKIEFTN
jgi:hypothetical protein